MPKTGRPTDPCWAYGVRLPGNKVQCSFCNRTYSSITNFKYHLASLPQRVAACNNVPTNVAEHARRLIQSNRQLQSPSNTSTCAPPLVAGEQPIPTAGHPPVPICMQARNQADYASDTAQPTADDEQPIPAAEHTPVPACMQIPTQPPASASHRTCKASRQRRPVQHTLHDRPVRRRLFHSSPVHNALVSTFPAQNHIAIPQDRASTSNHSFHQSYAPTAPLLPITPTIFIHSTTNAAAVSDTHHTQPDPDTLPLTTVPLTSSGPPHTLPTPTRRSVRHSLGPMNVVCPSCKALHWLEEKLATSSARNPVFGTCCLSGKICLPPLTPLPWQLYLLYERNDAGSRSFCANMRSYNSANAFTSLGTPYGPVDQPGRGPRTFTIHGQLRHRIGPLQSQQANKATYAQLYIYDPDFALQIRASRNKRCRTDVLRIIQLCLLQVNPFVTRFLQAHAILR